MTSVAAETALPGADTDVWPNTSRLLPWGLAAFLAMIWLVPFDAVSLPIPLPLDGKMDRPFVLVLLLLWFVAALVLRGPGRPVVRFTGVHVAIIVFFLAAVVGALLNLDALMHVSESNLFMKKLALLVSYMMVFGIVASSVRAREVERYVRLMLRLAVVAAIGTIWEYRFLYNPFYEFAQKIPFFSVTLPPDLYGRDSIGRLSVYGPAGHPLETATLLSMALPFAIVRALDEDAPRDQRIKSGLMAAVILAGAMATGRKTSVVAPAMAIFLIFAYRPHQMLRVAFPMIIGFGAAVHTLAPRVIGSLFYQLQPSNLTGSLSTQDRASDFDGVMPDVTKHLVFGRGYGTYDPHKYRVLDDEYLGLLINTGVVGIVCYVGMLLTALVAAHRLTRASSTARSQFGLGAAAAVLVVGVSTGLFDLMSFAHIPYMLMFLCGLIVASRRPEVADGQGRPPSEMDARRRASVRSRPTATATET